MSRRPPGRSGAGQRTILPISGDVALTRLNSARPVSPRQRTWRALARKSRRDAARRVAIVLVHGRPDLGSGEAGHPRRLRRSYPFVPRPDHAPLRDRRPSTAPDCRSGRRALPEGAQRALGSRRRRLRAKTDRPLLPPPDRGGVPAPHPARAARARDRLRRRATCSRSLKPAVGVGVDFSGEMVRRAPRAAPRAALRRGRRPRRSTLERTVRRDHPLRPGQRPLGRPGGCSSGCAPSARPATRRRSSTSTAGCGSCRSPSRERLGLARPRAASRTG